MHSCKSWKSQEWHRVDRGAHRGICNTRSNVTGLCCSSRWQVRAMMHPLQLQAPTGDGKNGAAAMQSLPVKAYAHTTNLFRTPHQTAHTSSSLS